LQALFPLLPDTTSLVAHPRSRFQEALQHVAQPVVDLSAVLAAGTAAHSFAVVLTRLTAAVAPDNVPAVKEELTAAGVTVESAGPL